MKCNRNIQVGDIYDLNCTRNGGNRPGDELHTFLCWNKNASFFLTEKTSSKVRQFDGLNISITTRVRDESTLRISVFFL